MNIRRILAVPDRALSADLTLVLLRLVAGVAFMFHGWGKIQHPFGWMGPEAAVPGVFQALAALSEFGGGLAWGLGLLTPLASLGILATMGYALRFHALVRGDPFVSKAGEPSFELAAIYFCIALLLLARGPGRYSLDRRLWGRRRS